MPEVGNANAEVGEIDRGGRGREREMGGAERLRKAVKKGWGAEKRRKAGLLSSGTMPPENGSL